MCIGLAAGAQDRFSISVVSRVETGAKFGAEEGYLPTFGHTSLFSNFDFRISESWNLRMNNRWLTTSPGILYTELGNPQCVNWLDILQLSFNKNRWHFQAGKLYVRMGGFEFECPNSEFHHNLMSNFWMHAQPYTWGASVGFDIARNNTISVTATNSPYSEAIFKHGLMAYSLAWDGQVGPVQTYWGLALLQRQDRSFLKSLGLGQRFYHRYYSAELDYTVRSDSWNTLFSYESTLTLKLAYEGPGWFQLHLKGGWEFTVGNEPLLTPGMTEPTFTRDYIVPLVLDPSKPYFFGGAYAYFYPWKANRNLRLHLLAAANNYYRGATVMAGVLYRLDFDF